VAAPAAAAAARARKALDPLTNVEDALPRQTALTAAAARALTGWSPAQIALWSTVFLLVIVGVPLAVWLLQRRRRPEVPDPDPGAL
jgi:hypothetical protein